MLKMIWQQFNHSRKQWFAALCLFIITGFLTGTCLNGIYTLMDHYPHLNDSSGSPFSIFIYPIFFGIITLFIVLNGVIKLVIYHSNHEYILWTILGAAPKQLSLLIGGQITLTALIGSTIGFIVAVPFTTVLYEWIRQLLGSHQYAQFPPLPLEISLPALFWTIIFVSLTAGIAGYIHSHKLFSGLKNDTFHFQKNDSKLVAIGKTLSAILLIIGLLFTYMDAIKVSPQVHQLIKAGQVAEAIKSYTSNLMVIMLLTITLFALVAPLILPFIIKLWTKLTPKNRFAAANTSFWISLSDQHYLTSLISPLFGASILLTGLSVITTDFTAGGSNQAAAANTLASVIVFLGAPLIIILTNVVIITLIASKQQETTLNQLLLLGFSNKNLLYEKLMESLIFGITLLICTFIGNLPFYLLIKQIGINLHHSMPMSLPMIGYWPLISFLFVIGFTIIISILRIIKTQKASSLD